MPPESIARYARSRQRGLSVIEMTLAMVILGIAFVMALKGAALVETMRAFMTSYVAQQYQTQVEIYLTENQYLPGDDPTAPARYGRPEAFSFYFGVPASHTGDYQIDGQLTDPVNADGEQYMAWRDLRYAGLIAGDPTLAGESAMPENDFGGVYGFDEGNLGQHDGSLCLTKVPGRAAQIIDEQLDDGVINTGKVVATSKFSIDAHNHFPAPDSEPYDVKKTYIVCMPIRP